MISQIEDTLNKSMEANKRPIAKADIIVVGGARYTNLLNMVSGAKETVNQIGPGTYPSC